MSGDALRYRWIKAQKGLTLQSDVTVWTRPDGSSFTSSHRLAANGTQYAAAETLDELINAAMTSDFEYCDNYHCAGDCGLPHNQAERVAFESDLEADLQASDDKRQEFEDRVLALLIELEEEGILSEGQCSKVWGGDLLDWRIASRPMPPVFGQEP